MVLKELIEYRGKTSVALSRPCVYGVFSGPLGGLAPRERRCVGCLRCTVEYPDVVRIEPNPRHHRPGDGSLSPEQVETLLYEARTGRVPVRGAGYRGRFGGTGWDGMWLDMSEIVRPTRDGIHGREYIATTIDVGARPAYLAFDDQGELLGRQPAVVEIAVPWVLDAVGLPGRVARVLAVAAAEIGTLALIPAAVAARHNLTGPQVVPLVGGPDAPPGVSRVIALDGWDPERFGALRRAYPESIWWVRLPADADVTEPARAGAGVIQLVGRDGRFLGDLIARAHDRLVAARCRDQVTVVASGGVVAADQVPKAIACGADAVGLDVAIWTALQGTGTAPTIPRFSQQWGTWRIINLAASWRDQLIEVLGAMGLREARRLRGERGRLLLQDELEREAFGGIPGYHGDR